MPILKKTDSITNRLTGLLSRADDAGAAFAGVLAQEQATLVKMAQFEAARLGAKYGAESDRAKEAQSLVDQLTLEAAYWALEQARADRKTPSIDPAYWVVFGLVLDQQGQRVSGATVTAVLEKGGVAAHAASNKDGEYELRIPATGRVQVRVASRDGKTETVGQEIFEGPGGKLAYRDYVLAAGPSYTRTGRKRRG